MRVDGLQGREEMEGLPASDVILLQQRLKGPNRDVDIAKVAILRRGEEGETTKTKIKRVDMDGYGYYDEMQTQCAVHR
jgi:hypothetical protein